MIHPYRILDPRNAWPDFNGKCALTVMAKVPVPGKVKTRLSPPLTAQEAAAINGCFLRDTIESLNAVALTRPAEWVVSYTPEGEEMAFRDILPEGAFLLPQRGEGFGERLKSTADDIFKCGFSAVCLIDSDSPTVPATAFQRAVHELLRPGPRAVLGPSTDGGYYLLGMKQRYPRLFEEISWSSDLVAAETLARAAEIGLPVTLLETWYDVDDSNSLKRLRAELLDPLTTFPKGYPAQNTREYLVDMANRDIKQTSHRSFA